MSDTEEPHTERVAPAPPSLGPAGTHRTAAEQAAARHDYDTALRERFRAVVRGLEQGGVLEVRRSRTARESADAAVATVPDQAVELPGAARSFDEVVYGGRTATEDEYQRLARADHFSLAPPPPPEPVETTARRTRSLRWRPPPLPQLLRSPTFWAVVAAVLLLLLIAYLLWHLASAPTAPPPQRVPPPDGRPELPRPEIGAGDDSIFGRWPSWLAYGFVQWVICAALVVWWRARRRGALVGEPRPVEVAANELLDGQAALYRKSADRDHVAAKLRTATLRRIRPQLGLTPEAPPDRVVAAIAGRLRADPNLIGAALFGPVPDDAALHHVAAQLTWIESEIG
ncbi:DUF4129 domain-containing protein [Nocardia transvalensis]|uniref:DUF4129 domain-containing protein n=1 Tax=Nocardia transvalensis TaxID=37333 RepID=UPI00189329D0|nr:DUF4129 domain-containing protein [Nocardia transvalensis]MBF6328671.1 DUF4129 domain-containing protein [Nocardia transvalensis]